MLSPLANFLSELKLELELPHRELEVVRDNAAVNRSDCLCQLLSSSSTETLASQRASQRWGSPNMTNAADAANKSPRLPSRHDSLSSHSESSSFNLLEDGPCSHLSSSSYEESWSSESTCSYSSSMSPLAVPMIRHARFEDVHPPTPNANVNCSLPVRKLSPEQVEALSALFCGTPGTRRVRFVEPAQGRSKYITTADTSSPPSFPARQPSMGAAPTTPLMTPATPVVCVKKLNFLKTMTLPLESPVTPRKPNYVNSSYGGVLDAMKAPLKSPLKRTKHSVLQGSNAA
jgi:hypothetical protein